LETGISSLRDQLYSMVRDEQDLIAVYSFASTGICVAATHWTRLTTSFQNERTFGCNHTSRVPHVVFALHTVVMIVRITLMHLHTCHIYS